MSLNNLTASAAQIALKSGATWRCASLVHDSSNSDLPGLVVVRHTMPGALETSIYRPVLGLILQGAATVSVGGQQASLGPGETFLVSHELPVATQITDASVGVPYLAAFVAIDLEIMRSLSGQISYAGREGEGRSLGTAFAEPKLIDAFERYLSLSPDSAEAIALAPIIQREIHFRVLVAPIGAMLRRLLLPAGAASKVAKAIGLIRTHYREALALAGLAQAVGMSQSSFHAHFKSVTGTTPLQYQKNMRLIEARRLLTMGQQRVTEVALSIGYESGSQFSRDYFRKFDASPRRHLAATSRR